MESITFTMETKEERRDGGRESVRKERDGGERERERGREREGETWEDLWRKGER